MLKTVEEDLKVFLDDNKIEGIVEVTESGNAPIDIDFSQYDGILKSSIKSVPANDAPIQLVKGLVLGSYEQMEENVLYLFPQEKGEDRVGLYKSDGEIIKYLETVTARGLLRRGTVKDHLEVEKMPEDERPVVENKEGKYRFKTIGKKMKKETLYTFSIPELVPYKAGFVKHENGTIDVYSPIKA